MSNGNWLLKAFQKFGLALILGLSLTACELTSKETFIENDGKRLGQDGYMTKDDYVISWPSASRGGDNPVIAPPLTLKIPKKWLRVLPLSPQSYYKAKDGTIISIYVMSSVPGPAPWVEPFPWEKEIKLEYFNFFEHYKDIKSEKKTHSKELLEKRALYSEAMRNSVSIALIRGTLPNSDLFSLKDFQLDGPYDNAPCNGLAVGQYSHHEGKISGCLREPDIDGLESYVKLICYSQEKLNGVDQKNYKEHLQRKAADDNSPDNCYVHRGYQSLKTPPNTPVDEQVIVNCGSAGCDAVFPLHKRRVEVLIEGLYSKNTYGKKSRDSKNPIRNEVNTELSRWREKVDIARKLVNSFVVDKSKT
jgi:hypothetical protein